MNMERIKQVGIGAAYRAGEILKKHFGNLETVRKKGDIDLVTAADLESEAAIIEIIRGAFPDHSLIAEENGSLEQNSHHCWIIDPLDGTTNYAHNLDQFSVSIAYCYQNEIMVGIVFNPISGELFTAVKGQGARLNNAPIRVSSTGTTDDSLLTTGFPYNLRSNLNTLMARFQNCLGSVQGVRRLGSAALDLCYVACGRFDGFWEENLNPWDTAAGLLIVKEAGGTVTDFKNHPFQVEMKQMLATNSRIHSDMISLLKIEEEE